MAGADGMVSCLIPAAGAGERLGQGTKGLLELRGRPLLCWLADKALQVADEVLVAVPGGRVEAVARLLPGCRVLAGVFQSPQAFARVQLLALIGQARADGWRPQSTLQLALRAGVPVAAVAGEKHNIKITTAEDWRWACAMEEYLS